MCDSADNGVRSIQALEKTLQVVRTPGSLRGRVAMTALTLVLASPLVCASGVTLLTCRQIADPALRFKCYESIEVPAPTHVPTQAAPSRQEDKEAFGLEQRRPQKSAPESLESSIVGTFYGWDANDKVQLANGQVWQIIDDSRGALVATNPKITIRRGALGAFYLEIEGTNRSPRVRRLK